MGWKAGYVSGKGLPSSDVGTFDDKTQSIVLLYTLPYDKFQHVLDTPNNLFLCGQISLDSVGEGKRLLSTNGVTEESTSFFGKSSVTDDDLRQWLPPPQLSLFDANTADSWSDFYQAYVEKLWGTLRFVNVDTTLEFTVFYKVVYPGEDSDGVLKYIDEVDAADLAQIVSVLTNYPGMKAVRLGQNSANGLPNTATVNFSVDVNKMRDYYFKTVAPWGGESISDTEIPDWVIPKVVYGTGWIKRENADPGIYFWLVNNGAPASGLVGENAGAVYVEGFMKKRIKLFSTLQAITKPAAVDLEA